MSSANADIPSAYTASTSNQLISLVIACTAFALIPLFLTSLQVLKFAKKKIRQLRRRVMPERYEALSRSFRNSLTSTLTSVLLEKERLPLSKQPQEKEKGVEEIVSPTKLSSQPPQTLTSTPDIKNEIPQEEPNVKNKVPQEKPAAELPASPEPQEQAVASDEEVTIEASEDDSYNYGMMERQVRLDSLEEPDSIGNTSHIIELPVVYEKSRAVSKRSSQVSSRSIATPPIIEDVVVKEGDVEAGVVVTEHLSTPPVIEDAVVKGDVEAGVVIERLSTPEELVQEEPETIVVPAPMPTTFVVDETAKISPVTSVPVDEEITAMIPEEQRVDEEMETAPQQQGVDAESEAIPIIPSQESGTGKDKVSQPESEAAASNTEPSVPPTETFSSTVQADQLMESIGTESEVVGTEDAGVETEAKVEESQPESLFPVVSAPTVEMKQIEGGRKKESSPIDQKIIPPTLIIDESAVSEPTKSVPLLACLSEGGSKLTEGPCLPETSIVPEIPAVSDSSAPVDSSIPPETEEVKSVEILNTGSEEEMSGMEEPLTPSSPVQEIVEGSMPISSAEDSEFDMKLPKAADSVLMIVVEDAGSTPAVPESISAEGESVVETPGVVASSLQEVTVEVPPSIPETIVHKSRSTICQVPPQESSPIVPARQKSMTCVDQAALREHEEACQDRAKVNSKLMEDKKCLDKRMEWLSQEEELFLDRTAGILAYFSIDKSSLQLRMGQRGSSTDCPPQNCPPGQEHPSSSGCSNSSSDKSRRKNEEDSKGRKKDCST